jgi:hypothetical protein
MRKAALVGAAFALGDVVDLADGIDESGGALMGGEGDDVGG